MELQQKDVIVDQRVKIFRIIDKQYYSGQLMYSVSMSSEDTKSKAVLINETILKSLCSQDPRNMQLLLHFHEWYDSNRYGVSPTRENLHVDLSQLLKIPAGQLPVTYTFLNDNNRNIRVGMSRKMYFSKTLIKLIHNSVDSMEFDFDVGFKDDLGRNIIDKKIVFTRVWRQLFRVWEQQIAITDYRLSQYVVGQNVWLTSELNKINECLKHSELFEFRCMTVTQSIEYLSHMKRRHKLIVFVSCPNKSICDSYSSLIIQLDGSADHWIPRCYDQGDRENHVVRDLRKELRLTEVRRHFSGFVSKNDTFFRTCEFVSKLLDGIPIDDAKYVDALPTNVF